MGKQGSFNDDLLEFRVSMQCLCIITVAITGWFVHRVSPGLLEWTRVHRLANFLRHYNPDLIGGSLGNHSGEVAKITIKYCSSNI